MNPGNSNIVYTGTRMGPHKSTDAGSPGRCGETVYQLLHTMLHGCKTKANYAAIDTTGAAAIFEAGNTQYLKYDAQTAFPILSRTTEEILLGISIVQIVSYRQNVCNTFSTSLSGLSASMAQHSDLFYDFRGPCIISNTNHRAALSAIILPAYKE